MEEEIPEPSDDDAPFVVKSDHEFSPESDVNDDDYEPTRRARTARRDKGLLPLEFVSEHFLSLVVHFQVLSWFFRC